MAQATHGSAPDIAGRGIANPIGQVWSGAMMLEHLGEAEAAATVLGAIETVVQRGPCTRDMGQDHTATTLEVGRALVAAVEAN